MSLEYNNKGNFLPEDQSIKDEMAVAENILTNHLRGHDHEAPSIRSRLEAIREIHDENVRKGTEEAAPFSSLVASSRYVEMLYATHILDAAHWAREDQRTIMSDLHKGITKITQAVSRAESALNIGVKNQVFRELNSESFFLKSEERKKFMERYFPLRWVEISRLYKNHIDDPRGQKVIFGEYAENEANGASPVEIRGMDFALDIINAVFPHAQEMFQGSLRK